MRQTDPNQLSARFLETSMQMANDAKRTHLRQLHYHQSWAGAVSSGPSSSGARTSSDS